MPQLQMYVSNLTKSFIGTTKADSGVNEPAMHTVIEMVPVAGQDLSEIGRPDLKWAIPGDDVGINLGDKFLLTLAHQVAPEDQATPRPVGEHPVSPLTTQPEIPIVPPPAPDETVPPIDPSVEDILANQGTTESAKGGNS